MSNGNTGTALSTDATALGAALLTEQLHAEIQAMLRHVLANGLAMPSSMSQAMVLALDDDPTTGNDLAALAMLHADLARLVAPARPGTLRLLQMSATRASVLGPLSNVRRLTLAAFFCLGGFMLVSLSPLVNSAAISAGLFELSGWQQLAITTFLLTAAGLGSTFQALFTAQTYVSRANYDPLFDASYWVRIGLGIVAGLMLAMLVPIEGPNHNPTVEKPLLALLGGFSARLVHRVLQRLVDTVESIFDGDRRNQVDAVRDQSRADARQSVTQSKLELAQQLVLLRDQLSQAGVDEASHQRLSALLDRLLDQPGVTAGPALPGSHNA
ncbi:hypothetical protein CDN99_25495 [Roseateles aquatilis]|uniref:Uncharacterized protein n=1 Tax=Roseateles aquatilis TaxID=431061 RepID=A0A246IUD2_9BURK|nr:hypothetical protein [Roseateles aquatilis]OWQ83823.1 hypothetical protein CDN99_25495 [Roseateles aquatilis]